MTICVGVQVNDCLVFAADSAVTLSYGNDPGGAEIINVLPHGNKVFHLHRDLPICAMFCGLGNIGAESVASLAKDLRVMDLTAITFCRDNGLPILVFDLMTAGNIRDALSGKRIGTLIA